jgi:TolB-like protein/Tfp pilus assembly protein PilF
MTDLWQRLQRRKLVQWAVAYVAAAFALLQGIDIVAQKFGWPDSVERLLIVAICIGFFVVLLLAWYHGEQGRQRVSGVELLLIALVLAVGGAVLWRSSSHAPKAPGSAATLSQTVAAPGTTTKTVTDKSVAVLPFENLSSDKDNAFFADGIQDQILTGLARIGDLKVISRTSTLRYASRPENLSDIARQLGVANILEGSVQKSGNRVRINVQLIRADSDSHLWAETYDRTLDDIFAVESEVAEKIAGSLAANLTGSERAALADKPTDNPEAYAAYLQARVLVASTEATRKIFDDILAQCRKAVALDPGFAVAWGELARWAINAHWIGVDPTGELRKEGEAALARAQQLAPDLPQTVMAHAVYLYYIQRDFAGALAEMSKVTRVLPGDSDAWLYSGYLARRVGLWEQSVSDLERARVLAPNNANIAYHLGVTYVSMRQCDRAMPPLDASLRLQADNPAALWIKLQCAWKDADLARADRMLAEQPFDTPGYTSFRAMQALFKHDYAQASGLYQRAVAGAGDIHIDSDFNGYIPAVVSWRLLLALSEQRAGNASAAQALYAQVKADATGKLAGKRDNPYVEAGWRAALGLALASLKEHRPATEQAGLVASLVPESKDALEGPAWSDYVARIYALNGDAARAVPLLRHLLGVKSSALGPGYLQLDPAWDPIRDDPGFQALLKQAPQHAAQAGAAGE